MAGSRDYDAMMALFEAAGEAGIDIVPIVFDRFFAAFPDTHALFLNLEAAGGRMVNETLEALLGLGEGAWWVETTIINFVDLHDDYGAIPMAQWEGWIDITVDVLVETAHARGGAAGIDAWRRQAERLRAMIAAARVETPLEAKQEGAG